VQASRATRAAPRPRQAAPTTAEVDAFLLGVFLFNAAHGPRREVLRITDEGDAHRYAASLRPASGIPALRALAAEVPHRGGRQP
jgi:hypothetical protein